MAQPTRRSQPQWHPPQHEDDQDKPKVSIYNSLTRAKVPFVPIDSTGRNVTWYTCGPTVYDDAHTGHARNYVSTDIIRRILQYYFKYNIKFVMNVTDVDDKIIVKAREEKLFEDFKHDVPPDLARKLAREAFQTYADQKLPNLAWDFENFPKLAAMHYSAHIKSLESSGTAKGDDEAKMEMHIRSLNAAHHALTSLPVDADELDNKFYDGIRDVVKPFLDKRDGHKFDQLDHTPFNAISRKYEDRFFEDMDRLNVLRPTVLTRVTEYGSQIVEYVERIVQSGFAYNVEGSIYFDIDAFEKAGRPYARLKPENRGDSELQAEGEGALSKGGNKRSKSDFALWKVSKPGEPAWSSPWGPGRPGWHIECSAMASDHFGKSMDIHSGGVDLAFPHHDNELAQSEAYWHDTDEVHNHDHQWVNYFLHMGHLTNKGQKMSKSLKNFTTIREALQTWTPRSLRIVYLLGTWNQPMEISEDMLKDSDSWEKTVNNFFLKVKTTERVSRSTIMTDKQSNGTSPGDKDLESHLTKAQNETSDALSDSFDTPKVMQIIRDLISRYNSVEKTSVSRDSAMNVAQWITKMVRIFGLDENRTGDEAGNIGWTGLDLPEDIRESVYLLADRRDALRKSVNKLLKKQKAQSLRSDDADAEMAEAAAQLRLEERREAEAGSPQRPDTRQSKQAIELVERFRNTLSALESSKPPLNKYLQLTDAVRNDWLWDIGVYLEDPVEEGEPAVVRPVDNEMRTARIHATKVATEKAQHKKAEQEKLAKLNAEKEEKAKVDPRHMFRTEDKRKEFSAWDDDGIPTKDEKGGDLTKNKLKKVKKEWETQKKAFEAYQQRSK